MYVRKLPDLFFKKLYEFINMGIPGNMECMFMLIK